MKVRKRGVEVERDRRLMPGPPTGGADHSFGWIGGSVPAGGRPIRLRGKLQG
jgi:hypothetical protein